MKTAKLISWIYLIFIVLLILMKGIPGMFNTIGWVGNGLITIAIIVVVQQEKVDKVQK